jgi:hypothetical protein
MAIVILLDANDPRGDALARKYICNAQPHHEVSDAEVEIVWRYRHAYPDAARRWFLPQPCDAVPFVNARARLGDPVAVRHKTVDAEETKGCEPSPAAQQDELHRDLLNWARTDHHWSPPQTEKLQTAHRMAWPDVAHALQENPFLLSVLLTSQRRDGQFDEPGILMANEFLLVWSRLAPSAFLARIIAAAHTTDLYALAERASRASALGKPNVAANIETSLRAYQVWLKDLQPALAISWKRCRASGV